MRRASRVAVAAIGALLMSAPARGAQTPPPQAPSGQTTPASTQKPAPETKEQTYEETVVVSGSRTEEKIGDTPATMTVIGSKAIESAPSQNFAELLRTVPGLNVTQVSARDINVTSRAATGTLATGQLALLDGRSLYQDFFGFVMWDFLPVNLNEIKQIEVIRGPASAVWGANALYGVVNVLTKSPREMQGTTGVFGFGGFDRGGDPDAGTLWYASATHAQAINDRWAFKVSGGGYSQDPLARPTGIIPGSPGSSTGGGTPYPPYVNTGTAQPKIDARVDYDYEDGRKLTFSGGVSGTEGIMHTGIGPFDINNGSVMSYVKANYSTKGFHAAVFTQTLNGDASSLLTRDASFNPILFAFDTKTLDFEASNVQSFQNRHVVNYGGNLRFNSFDLSLAPGADSRTEFGVYAQDEIFLTPKLRLSAGARVDRFDYLDDFVFSPRVALLVKPVPNHTLRVSYNRAYRSPSVINNFLDVTIAEPIDLGRINPALAGRVYPLPIKSVGNTDLTETLLDAYEVGYTGIFKTRTVVSAAWYVNESSDDIFFTEVKDSRWTPANPPPGWPLPPAVIGIISGGAGFPALFTYQNFGRTTQKGLELGVDSTINPMVAVFANYSFQATPVPHDFDISELNLPPTHRFNAGVTLTRGRYFGNVAVNHSSDAFWQDVLDDRYHGTTEPYTMVNGGVGLTWADGLITTSLKTTNLGNQKVQQHVFGDITKRMVLAEFRVQF